MNTTVSAVQVGGLRARIKDTATDIVLAELESNLWGESEGQLSVSFNIPEDTMSRLVIGNFYKVQLAYYKNVKLSSGKIEKVPGYYSTVGIVKYTVKPILSMVGLQDAIMNTITSQQFIGSYSNSDSTERVYQYRFTIHSLDGSIIEDSGWLLHNSYLDTNDYESTDTYVCKRELYSGWMYYIQYSVITTNGLEESSVRFQVTKTEDSGAELLVSLATDLDYENGRVKVFIPDPTEYLQESYIMGLNNGILQGTFILARTSSDSNYQQWEILSNFTYQSDYHDFVYWDYTVAAGVEYKYSLQKYNTSGIFSPKVTSKNIRVYFEDIFLFDGARQLKVRFNPKVSSFKEIVSETKKTTLGNQFPFILRNGAVRYKEFPVNGLLSYLSDNEKLFMSREELRMAEDAESETDITDENIYYEKLFKLQALDWLNNGGIKIFRSPQEGNYIVRLMNISLTPNDTVSRMLHTFQCTATQVSEFNIERLEEYKLTSPELNKNVYSTYTYEVSLSAVRTNLSFQYPNDSAAVLKALAEMDLTAGKEILSLTITGATYGSIFQWGQDYDFVIGVDGKYNIERSVPSIAELHILNPVEEQTAKLVFTVVGEENEKFEATSTKSHINYLGYSIYGPEIIDITKEIPEGDITQARSQNLLAEFNNYPQDIETMYVIQYKQLPYIKDTSKQDPGLFAKNKLGAMIPYTINRMVVLDYDDNAYLITGYERDKASKEITSVTVTEIKDYKDRFYVWFGDPEADPIDISDFSSGTVGIDIKKDIPRYKGTDADVGKYYFAIGGCVLADLYFQGSFTEFSQQYDNEILQKRAQEADDAYCNYLSRLFSLRESNQTRDTIFMIYKNRRFYYVTADQAYSDTYAAYKKYSPIPQEEADWTEGEITSSKEVLEQANFIFSNALKEVIEKEGK